LLTEKGKYLWISVTNPIKKLDRRGMFHINWSSNSYRRILVNHNQPKLYVNQQEKYI
jgi:hypothetical protein